MLTPTQIIALADSILELLNGSLPDDDEDKLDIMEEVRGAIYLTYEKGFREGADKEALDSLCAKGLAALTIDEYGNIGYTINSDLKAQIEQEAHRDRKDGGSSVQK